MDTPIPRKNAVKLQPDNIPDENGWKKKKGTMLIALCVLCCLLAGALVSCRFTETDEPEIEDAPAEEPEEADLDEPEDGESELEPTSWQKELSIYRCDDVYRTDKTPTRGNAVVTIPELPPDYEVRSCDVLLCDDGCDPTDVLSRAFWGYAPVFRIENYVEFDESDGWPYPARRYDFTPPDDAAESMRESGAPEYQIYSRKYLYLLTVDESRYAYFEIQAKDEEAPKPDGEEETVDEIVRAAVIETDYPDEPPIPAYVPVEYNFPAPENFDFNWSMYDAVTQEFVGYTVNGEEGAAYYNCVTDRYITGFDYESFEVCGRYLIARQSRYDGPEPLGLVSNVVLDSVTGQLLYDFGEEERASPSTNGVSFLTSGAGIFFRNENGWPDFDLYTEDFRPVGHFWLGSADGDGNFVGIGVIPNEDGFDPGKTFFVYSPAGELLRESREYDGIFFVNHGLILVNDGGRLRLLDSSENLLADFDEWTDDLYMHWQISGYAASGKRKGPNWETEYYTLNGDGSYTPAEEPEVYPPCCWFTIEDRSIPYGTMGSGKEYLYYPETGEAAVLWTTGVGGYAKPVLYLYPEEETDVTVTFAQPDALTTTYPKYETAWEVAASPDGTLTDVRGRHYYALYWEERGYLPVDFREGFCVAAADAASFLEDKLGILGLTEREANEFILYWLPVMERNPYSLVYFELTESRQAWNRLTISPEPDSLLRIAMHVKGVDEPAEMREQRLPKWERTGFSAVEWGGVVVP